MVNSPEHTRTWRSNRACRPIGNCKLFRAPPSMANSPHLSANLIPSRFQWCIFFAPVGKFLGFSKVQNPLTNLASGLPERFKSFAPVGKPSSGLVLARGLWVPELSGMESGPVYSFFKYWSDLFWRRWKSFLSAAFPEPPPKASNRYNVLSPVLV